jgi:glutamate-1-semialdehyde 2,1-aminomutase
LSGNPIAMVAGYTLLKHLNDNPSIYSELEEKTNYLGTELRKVFQKKNTAFVINQLGSMISVHFSDHPVRDFASASSANNALFNKFFHAMLDRGIYLPPSAYETWFLSNSLTREDLDETIRAAEESLNEILTA